MNALMFDGKPISRIQAPKTVRSTKNRELTGRRPAIYRTRQTCLSRNVAGKCL